MVPATRLRPIARPCPQLPQEAHGNIQRSNGIEPRLQAREGARVVEQVHLPAAHIDAGHAARAPQPLHQRATTPLTASPETAPPSALIATARAPRRPPVPPARFRPCAIASSSPGGNAAPTAPPPRSPGGRRSQRPPPPSPSTGPAAPAGPRAIRMPTLPPPAGRVNQPAPRTATSPVSRNIIPLPAAPRSAAPHPHRQAETISSARQPEGAPHRRQHQGRHHPAPLRQHNSEGAPRTTAVMGRRPAPTTGSAAPATAWRLFRLHRVSLVPVGPHMTRCR